MSNQQKQNVSTSKSQEPQQKKMLRKSESALSNQMTKVQIQCESSSESWRHTHPTHVTAQASANLQPNKRFIIQVKCRFNSTIIQRFRLLSTLAQKASSEPQRNQRKRHPHPVQIVTKQTLVLYTNSRKDASLERKDGITAAYFSTKERNVGSSSNALSETS